MYEILDDITTGRGTLSPWIFSKNSLPPSKTQPYAAWDRRHRTQSSPRSGISGMSILSISCTSDALEGSVRNSLPIRLTKTAQAVSSAFEIVRSRRSLERRKKSIGSILQNASSAEPVEVCVSLMQSMSYNVRLERGAIEWSCFSSMA